MNTTLIYSDYQFSFEAQQTDFEMKLVSSIKDYASKIDLTWLQSYRNTLKFGAEAVQHTFVPGSASARIGETEIDPDNIMHEYARDGALYINDEFDLGTHWKINAGVRATLFQQIGEFDRYLKDLQGNNKDTIHYKKGETVTQYQNIEPRLSLRLALNSTTSIKAAYTQNYQYVHLASISSVSLPTDLWLPSTEIIQPQFGVQYAVGIFKNLKENMFETSIELYYKHLENQIEYKDGANPGSGMGDNTDNFLAFGSGQSYGAELFMNKKLGDFTGWIGYTYSHTTRQFADINHGKEFPAKYDRTHDLSVVVSYAINPNLVLSSVFVYATGNTGTLPIGRYVIGGSIINEYGERNSYRMDSYHRLDLSLTRYFKILKKYDSSFNISVYNIYNRKNPYFIYFETTGTIEQATLTTTAKQVSLFPILPSITWNFEF